MKKHTQILILICFGCLFLQTDLYAQKVPYKVIKDKVVFSDTIKTKLNKEQIETQLKAILIKQEYNEGSMLNANDDSIKALSLRMTDYLAIEKRPLSIFAIMMRYFLIMEIKDNSCIANITGISYIEPDEYEKKIRLKDNNFDIIPGELVILEKKYKSIFIPNASDKIIHKTYQRVDELFAQIRTAVRK